MDVSSVPIYFESAAQQRFLILLAVRGRMRVTDALRASKVAGLHGGVRGLVDAGVLIHTKADYHNSYIHLNDGFPAAKELRTFLC